jgi:Flp pilus assembly protein TadG
MKSLFARSRGESGQVFVFVAVIMVALVGMAALVIDVGSWFHAQRKLQTAADAAALAGVQELPFSQTNARTVALQYAQNNYGGIPAPAVTFPDSGTIDVTATADTPGIFAPVLNSAFGIVTVHAAAQARVLAPSQLKSVAPIAVRRDVACVISNPSCFGPLAPKTLDFDDGASTSSKYGLLNLKRSGTASTAEMVSWTSPTGYPGFLPVNVNYPDANGSKNGIKNELDNAVSSGRVLLFPVFDTASAAGFHVIGWAAFVITQVVSWNGSDGPGRHRLRGYFTTFIATDLAAGNPITDPNNDFGVHVVTLTK